MSPITNPLKCKMTWGAIRGGERNRMEPTAGILWIFSLFTTLKRWGISLQSSQHKKIGPLGLGSEVRIWWADSNLKCNT